MYATSVIRADLLPLLSDCPYADDIILCASELAANATLHSDSARPGGTITVRAYIPPGQHVRIEVSDQGGTWNSAGADDDALTAWTSSPHLPPAGESPTSHRPHRLELDWPAS